jgi:phage baseplate assembly protein W
VGQILGTICENGATHGELPWDTEFGSALILLHHKNPDNVFEHLARVYVEQALQRWEPRAITKDVKMIPKVIDGESHVILKVKFDIAANRTPGSAIIAKDLMASTFLS